MDGILLAEHLIKSIKERRERISEMLTGGTVKNIEEYKQMVGNIESLDYIGQELREILEKSELVKDMEDNLVSIKEAYVKPEEKVLDPSKLDGNSLSRMPEPTGWRMLILPYRGKGKTEGGVLLPDAVVDRESVATVCGYVLKTGPLAYKDKDKFPGGAWCKERDWVIFGRYAGARFRIDGGEVRILNDDEIIAVIQDPEDILHF